MTSVLVYTFFLIQEISCACFAMCPTEQEKWNNCYCYYIPHHLIQNQFLLKKSLIDWVASHIALPYRSIVQSHTMKNTATKVKASSPTALWKFRIHAAITIARKPETNVDMNMNFTYVSF